MRGALLAACVTLAACAGQPVPYHSQNEIPVGPGLLSGADGAFVLRPFATPPAEPAPSSHEPSASPRDGSAAPRDAAEEREFQEWREWKRRQNP